jgi:hypothetical protein
MLETLLEPKPPISNFRNGTANFRSSRLGILETILHDQLKALGEFEQAIARLASSDRKLSVTQNKVLQSHLERIQRMDKQAGKAYQAVSNQRNLGLGH